MWQIRKPAQTDAETDEERRQVLASIGPVWDGNEVWLVAAGGTLFFGFPALYASGFSGFYLPLMIVLWHAAEQAQRPLGANGTDVLAVARRRYLTWRSPVNLLLGSHRSRLTARLPARAQRQGGRHGATAHPPLR